jgi:lysophospholipase L1-like esterase
MPLGRLAPAESTVNRGVAFESGDELLERLDVGIPQQPGGIVFYMTSIDHRFEGASPKQIRYLGTSIIDQATLLWPSAPIAVLALLPEVSMEKSRVEALEEANSNLGELCHIRGIPFITVSDSPLTLADGSLDPDLSSDPLHLNDAGYDHLWRAILMKSGPLGETLGR